MEDSGESGIPLKIAVLGQTLVGKSALTFRFINDKFPNEHDTTIEDSYSFTAKIDGINCQLEILDTAGQDDYQTMLDTWINSSDGFVLVYSIDNKESFESTKKRYERILKLKGDQKVAIVVAGNKCDLEESRKVSKEEAENFCLSNKITFMETSALKVINVKEAFLSCAKGLLQINFPEKYKNVGKEGGKKKCYCF
jgi:small GTP-binding protein